MRRRSASFARSTSGATALEFAMVLPIFLALMFSVFEAGWMMSKAIMLDRALNITVRLMRVGATDAAKTQADIKKQVCAKTLIILDCENVLTIEMTEVKAAGDVPTTATTCIDRGASVKPIVSFNPGARTSIVFVRACAVSDPLTPLIGLALNLSKDSKGGYSIMSSSAFVNEPG